jgi:HD superfamily phosphohydrolase
MALAGDFEVIRDPLWNNIQIDGLSLRVVDSAPFQRLRYVRQLGHAYLVYPGATHSRFEHALGTYHLASQALSVLSERGELAGINADDLTAVRLAALLHDIGHYPFSHALEEAGLPSHECLAARHFENSELRAALDAFEIASPASQLGALIAGTSASALQGLIAGSLDLDKIEYLTRDARMCGVPYGTVDVDRLIHSTTLVEDSAGGRTIGLHEKGVSALESLLFAKYQMYRNVYWHHAIRSATAMFKRLIRTAIAHGAFDPTWIAESSDESLMEAVRGLPTTDLRDRLRRRQLYKRVVDLPAIEVPAGGGEWIAAEPELSTQVEDRLAAELAMPEGGVLVDYPAKPDMLSLDVALRMRDGQVEHLGTGSGSSLLGIRRITEELHMSARRLRVFTAGPVSVTPAAIVALAERSPEEMRDDLDASRNLLS